MPGVPTARSFTTSFKQYGVGALAGAVSSVATGFLGNGFLGSLAAPVIASSIVKGEAGNAISSIAGYEIGKRLMAGGVSSGNSGGGRGTM